MTEQCLWIENFPRCQRSDDANSLLRAGRDDLFQTTGRV